MSTFEKKISFCKFPGKLPYKSAGRVRIREIPVKFSRVSRTRQIDCADDSKKASGSTTGTALAALSVKIDDTLAANFKAVSSAHV
jgi:hypothetical protein